MHIKARLFVVSGGSSGLGLATVKDIISAGGYVAILDLRPPPETLTNTRFIKTDVSSLTSITSAVDAVKAWSEEIHAPISGAINCAGIGTAVKMLTREGDVHGPEIWDKVIAINLSGTFHLSRLLIKEMAKSPAEDATDAERGVIIFAGSAAAFEGQPGQTAYSASKGALGAMCLPMARDLAPYGIRVVTIASGAFSSPMTDIMPEPLRKSLVDVGVAYPKRLGKAEEFARTVRYIIECNYVNGETIRLSGAGRLPAKVPSVKL